MNSSSARSLESSTTTERAHVDAWTRSLDRVVPLGRQGLGVPDNLHHVLAMGADAAEAIVPDGGVDRLRWGRALDRFADHVVED